MSKKVKNLEIKQTSQIYYDQNNIQGEMMRYRSNGLSYTLGMAAILFSILGAFICLNSIKWDVTVIIKILGNIAILLFGFLSIEKVKAYSKEYSLILLGIGGVCVLRIFWIPIQLFIWYGKYLANPLDTEVPNHLGPTVIGDPQKNSYLPQSGYVRGTAAIVLISIAAVLFLASGLIGYLKARKYHEYMKTQDTSKGV